MDQDEMSNLYRGPPINASYQVSVHLANWGRGTCGNGKRNVKIWIDFRKSPRFSLTSPLSQEREKSSRPVFTMCGEPSSFYVNIEEKI
jgi:hypothetical protein